jgi:hypothetical protein
MNKRRSRRRSRRIEHGRVTAAKRTAIAGAGVSLGVTLAAGATADAATFTATNLNDSGAGSLRQAILDANANPGGDQVTFQSTLSGQITLASELPVTDAVDVLGPGADKLTISGNNSSRIFNVDVRPAKNVPVMIGGLKLTGGNAMGGGAIASKYANLTVSKAVISGNTAQFEAGGIFNSGGQVRVESSTINGSSVGDIGGGIVFEPRSGVPSGLTIENSTITGNMATHTYSGGGGVWFYGYPNTPLVIKGSTISSNSALGTPPSSGGGGGLYVGGTSPPVTVVSAIVGDNSAPVGPDVRTRAGVTVNTSFSLIENTADAAITSSGPNIFGQDPKLQPLAGNGGPTPTIALASTSPAIDRGAASGLTTDQRGVLRPIDFPSIPNAAGGDGSDMGAFELQPDNALTLGKLKRNQKAGTAQQVVLLPLPDAGTLTISGKGLKTKTKNVADTGRVKLKVVPKGKKRAQENRTGKVKLKAKITYKPTGNATKTLKRKVKLLKRH